MYKETVIEVNTVSKRYGSNAAIEEVSFEVKQGELFGLIGRNGAGKSTLLEMLLGNRRFDEGTIQILGHEVNENTEKLKEHINIFMQSTTLVDKMTVREALEMFQGFYNRRDDIYNVLKQFGLLPYEDKLVRRLSGGLRQRTALAIAVINDPDIVILDEPTTGLDADAKREYWAVLSALKLQGKTIVIASHDMTEIQYHCDKVGVMRDGRLVACERPAKLIEELPGGGLTMEAVYMHHAVNNKGGVGV